MKQKCGCISDFEYPCDTWNEGPKGECQECQHDGYCHDALR
jgi:hypothetical protein